MIEITTAADSASGVRRMVDELGTVVVHPVSTYSQLMQDRWVLAQLGHKKGGTFIDIGAHDGIHFSNTYLLEREYGWKGVCVEPHPETYHQLAANRAKALNCAAWSESGKSLHFHQAEHPMLSGLSPEGEVEVTTQSLNDICQELDAIDYLSLDTEGSELEILSTFDVDRFKPKCMTIEHNGNKDVIVWLINWLGNHGYLLRFFHWDAFAVRDEWVPHP